MANGKPRRAIETFPEPWEIVKTVDIVRGIMTKPQTQRNTDRALLGKRDVVLFVGIVALAIMIYALVTLPGLSGEGAFARVSVHREVVQTIDLSEDGEFDLHQNPHIRFSVRDGAIAFIKSDCPDKTCIHSGYLRHSGQMAACVPNLVSLVIIGREIEGGVDAVAH